MEGRKGLVVGSDCAVTRRKTRKGKKRSALWWAMGLVEKQERGDRLSDQRQMAVKKDFEKASG